MNLLAKLGPLAALAGLLVVAPARGQGRGPADAGKPEKSGSDLKVAYYYKRADPAGTFRTQVYDLRKGQYDAGKVGAWLATMARDYPGYAAYVLGVDLDREPGATEEEKLAAVRSRELRAILVRTNAATSADLDRTLSLFRRSSEGLGPSAPWRGLPDVGRPVGAANFRGGVYGPARPSSPFPYPYVRPHP